GGESEPSDEARGEIGDDVTVEIREHEHVVLLGPLDELHAKVVHDPVLELEVGVLLGNLAGDAKEEPVRELHDVGLVYSRDLASAVAPRVVERELHDPPAPADRKRL